MPYIGNTSPSRFVSNRAASVYSGDGSTTAFTLEQAVVQDEDILVSVDGVVQEPSVAYAVSNGTTLTFTAAPSSNAGNNIFVYYLASQVGTAGPPNDSVSTTTLKNSAVTNAKVANSTLDLTSKVTGVLPVANGGTGVSSASIGIVSGYHRATPASATVSSGNIVGSFTQQGNSVGVTFSGNNKWTLGSAGVWSIDAKIYLYGQTNPASAGFSITKNGSEFCNSIMDTAGYAGTNGDFCLGINCTAEFSANDYIQIKNTGDFTLVSGDNNQNSHITLVKLGVLA